MNTTIFLTFDAFMHSKRAAGLSRSTIAWYDQMIRRWLLWCEVEGADWLSPDDMEAYIDEERARGLADRSIDGFFRCSKTFYKWIKQRRKNLLDGRELPTNLMERPKVRETRPRVAEYETVCRLIDAIKPVTWLDYRDKAVIQTMLSTGLRLSEVTNLREDQVNMEERFLLVENGKGGKDRLVPFDVDAELAICDYVRERPISRHDLLFLGGDAWHRPTGRRMTPLAVQLMIRKRCVDMYIPHINPHGIRHCFAIKALNDGVELSAVSTILGHASVSFTAKYYAKWVKRGLRAQYDQFWRSRSAVPA